MDEDLRLETANVPARRVDAFQATISSGNAVDDTVVKAATASSSIYVTDVVISVETALAVELKDETGTALMHPVYLGNTGSLVVSFKTPIMVAEGKALMMRASAAGDVSVTATGYVA